MILNLLPAMWEPFNERSWAVSVPVPLDADLVSLVARDESWQPPTLQVAWPDEAEVLLQPVGGDIYTALMPVPLPHRGLMTLKAGRVPARLSLRVQCPPSRPRPGIGVLPRSLLGFPPEPRSHLPGDVGDVAARLDSGKLDELVGDIAAALLAGEYIADAAAQLLRALAERPFQRSPALGLLTAALCDQRSAS